MTIAAWNILLNAIIAVLLVGYGIWFKFIVRHQLNSKDAAIEALQTTITTKDAMIEQLQGEKAPAIAQNYKIMKEHANEISAMNMKLKEDVKNVSAEKALLEEKLPLFLKWVKRKEEVRPARRLYDQIEGILIAYDILSASVDPILFDAKPLSTEEEDIVVYKNLVKSFFNALHSLIPEMDTRMERIDGVLEEIASKMDPAEKAEYLEWRQSHGG